MEKIIKWGFIGCGEVTRYKSGPAFQKIENSEVVAVMSRNGDKAKNYAKEHGIAKWYDDAQKLINDPEVNAVYIATPPSSHANYAIMAMQAGKPVYIEKPMAVTYEECCRINRTSEETGVPCFVAYYRRYLPYFLKVKELIETGTLHMFQSGLKTFIIYDKLFISEETMLSCTFCLLDHLWQEFCFHYAADSSAKLYREVIF